MTAAIRAEFRKLLTVRSTYVIVGLCLLITIFFAFFIEGYRQSANVTSPDKLASEVTGAAQSLGLFIALVGILLMTHEYRHNTIVYTLTAARRRMYVLAAKILAVSTFAVIMTLIVSLLSSYLTQLGLHAKGLTLAPQHFPLAELLLRAAFYGWAYSMFGLIIATIVRNQVGTIAVLFLYPSIAESLLSLLLRDNAKFLPFSALGALVQDIPRTFVGVHVLTHSQAATVVLLYILIGWAVGAWLFLKRDAS